MKKIIIVLFCFILFAGCSQEQRAERTYAKAKAFEESNNYQEAINLYNHLLTSYPETEKAKQIKNENLLETAYFNMGKFKLAAIAEKGQNINNLSEEEFLNLNATIQDEFNDARAAFEYVLQHYPQSQYKDAINIFLDGINQLAPKMQKMLTTKANIAKYVSEKKWQSANEELNKIKNDITPEHYKLIEKQINDARYAPVDSTINRVVNYVGSIMDADYSVHTIQAAMELIQCQGERVKVQAVIESVDRRRKSVKAYNGPRYSGESVEVFYEGTTAENYFLDNEPASSQTYTIVGKVCAYRNTGGAYIRAESITLNSR
ncbi:hypothetical protein [Candidatus Avelusimicrobium alvi]|uniref:hypothetical protein n=1 Tax=Candidatus Avelusimicrobium alvi TaxID=3416221 RepID=UPI003D0A0274